MPEKHNLEGVEKLNVSGGNVGVVVDILPDVFDEQVPQTDDLSAGDRSLSNAEYYPGMENIPLGYLGSWPGQNQYGRLFYETDDGAFRYLFDGRIFLDTAFYAERENPLADGIEVRDLRAGVKATLWRDWRAELDVKFTDNEAELRDAWIAYAGFDSAILKIGNFKEPFSLEELISKRAITFMERATTNVFAPRRHLGIGYNQWGPRWQFGAGFFGQEAGTVDDRDLKDPNDFRGANQGYGASGRFTVVPILTDDCLLHLGFATNVRTPDLTEKAKDLNQVRFRTRPETHVNRTRFANTGHIDDVRDYAVYGLELAGCYRAFSLQGEYMNAIVDRVSGKPNASFDGAYVQLSWRVTGERRPYNFQTAEFESIVPYRRTGAWELATRYSVLDLNDANHGILGGREAIVTFGVNWYINTNIRLMSNYALVSNGPNANDHGDAFGNDRFSFFQTRCQLTF